MYSKRKNIKTNDVSFKLPSKTKSEFAVTCDINALVRRHGYQTLCETNFEEKPCLFGHDFTTVPTYQEALNALNDMQDEFMRVPAEIRAEFENNPQKFIDFIDSGEFERKDLKKSSDKDMSAHMRHNRIIDTLSAMRFIKDPDAVKAKTPEPTRSDEANNGK